MVGIFISGLICGIVGVFFSVFALKEIKNKTKLNGKGLAIAGLVISIIDIVSVVLYMIKILALIL